MRKFIIYLAVLSLLAMNCLAVTPIKLEGGAGRAILDSMANRTLNQTGAANQTQNRTQNQTGEDLWSWGSLPAGFTLDESGKLVRIPTGEVEWLPGL